MDEKEKREREAAEQQSRFLHGLNDYNASLLRFWQDSGMLRPGMRAVDLGCGVGKYGTCLAELGCEVTLVDVSEEMLRLAAENMARFRTPWTVWRCDFREATGREPVFAAGFDFALSTMSPAVCDADTVRKMSGMTRGWCFLARFCEWRQPLRDELMRRAGLEPRSPHRDPKASCEALIRAVGEAGFTPQVKTVDYNWSDERTPEQMAAYLCRRHFAGEEQAAKLQAEFQRISAALADERGLVTDAVNTRVAWIFWRSGGGI